MNSKSKTFIETSVAITGVAVVLVCYAPVCSGEEKSNERTGESIYKQYCSSCHIGGGHRVKTSKPVAGSKVLKNIATFQKYLEDPPGHMPYYKTIVTDKTVVKKLYDYCKTLKKTEGA